MTTTEANLWRRNQRTHAIRRARERYGIRLTPDDYEALVASIQAGLAPEIERTPKGGVVHLVPHRHLFLEAVYSARTCAITTFRTRC